MQPSQSEIFGTKGVELKGKNIVLCVTGSIAALKAPEVARELTRYSASVVGVMSRNAQKIIHPYALEWATGRRVITEITGQIENIQLLGEHEGKCDLVLVAPATDNTISKVAHAINDTPVTSMVVTALGSRVPVVVCPAMHEVMYQQPMLLENIRRLRSFGVEFVGPIITEGKAKIAEAEDIVEVVIRCLTPKVLRGVRALVTAGPTYEPLDPIRTLSNKSTGRMGIALAAEVLRRGGQVTLVYGPGRVPPPLGARTIRVGTTSDMYDAVMSELRSKSYDMLIASAAAADFTPIEPSAKKLPSRNAQKLTVNLQPTPKIIDAAKKVKPEIFLVAFKAEHGVADEELQAAAERTLRESGADMIVANDVSRPGVGFEHETNEVLVVDRWGDSAKIPLASKAEVAKKIIDLAIPRFTRRKQTPHHNSH